MSDAPASQPSQTTSQPAGPPQTGTQSVASDKRTCSLGCASSFVVLLNRIALGLYLVLAGAGKVQAGVGNFYKNSFQALKPEWLSDWFAQPYGYALPFLEILVGGLLILGILGRFAAFAAFLMITSFTIALSQAGETFWDSKFFSTPGPFHPNVIFITLALLLLVLGPGRFQLGGLIRRLS